MTEMSIPQAIDLALAHHSAGRLDQAEHIYRQVLTVSPQHPDALHLLGVIAHQAGQHQAAIELINKAIQTNPNVAAYFNNIGEAYRAIGNINASESAYLRAIQLGANYPDPFSNLAIVYLAQGRVDEAIASAQKAIELNPNFAAAYVNLGDAAAERNPDLALAAFARALELNPNLPTALSNMGYLLAEKGHLDQAVAACRRAVEIDPNRAEGYLNLSYALAAHNMAEEAITTAHRALELRPDMVDAYTNLGFAYDKLSRMEDVVESFKKALQLNPTLISAWKNLGVAQFKLGRTEESRDTLRHALEVDPEHHESRLNYAAALLSLGDYEQGWKEYESRWKYDVFARTNKRELPSPWDGSDPAGKTLLLISEQGLGDTLQFIRYAPILAKMGARVISASPPLLHTLVKSVEGVAEVCHTTGPHPPNDLQANLMSLPLLMKTRVETIPHDVPYIRVPQEKLDAWKQRVEQDPKDFRIGISWAGSPKHAHDKLRSTTFQALTPLAQIPNVVFYTLQLGEAAKQTATRPPEMTLVEHTADLTDFSDTGALISHLDLVISVDTALVHLAGALALPVWTLLPVGPDLRWLKDRSDSPWYPTMRLFRLKKLNDWPPLIEEVATELRRRVNSR